MCRQVRIPPALSVEEGNEKGTWWLGVKLGYFLTEGQTYVDLVI
jgi:hypothetical protein